VGRGSTFWFEIPIEIIGPAKPTPMKEQVDRGNHRLTYDSKVLLVEDNPVNREVAKALLESFGATVATANDGQAAIENCISAQFDFVVMDLQMPVMDGIAATQELRKLGFDTPIIGLTANAFAEDRQKCLDAGMDDFVAKPVTRTKISSIFTSYGTSTEPRVEDTLIDTQQLNAVREELGAPLFSELLAHFANDGQELRSVALAEPGDEQSARVDAALHSLKGAASTLGLASVASLAQDMRSAEQFTPETVENLIDLITKSLAQVEQA